MSEAFASPQSSRITRIDNLPLGPGREVAAGLVVGGISRGTVRITAAPPGGKPASSTHAIGAIILFIANTKNPQFHTTIIAMR